MQALAYEMAEYWWTFVIRGIFAVLFAFAAFAWPGMTLLILTIFFGAYAIVDGVTSIVMAFGNKKWFWYLLGGIVSIAAGVIAFTYPVKTAVVLIIIIGAWAFVKGIFEIVAAIQLRKEIENEWLMVLGGVASIIFGLLVMIRPGPGALAVTWLIALYALIFGLLYIVLGFRLKGLKKPGGAAPSGA